MVMCFYYIFCTYLAIGHLNAYSNVMPQEVTERANLIDSALDLQKLISNQLYGLIFGE
jgi:hypothetical protein